MVLFLAFGLVLFPINNTPGEQKGSVATYAPAIGESLFCNKSWKMKRIELSIVMLSTLPLGWGGGEWE